MKFSNIHKSIYLLLVGLILFVGIGFGLMLMKTHKESNIFKQTEKNLEYALKRTQGELKEQEDYLKRFNQDSDFLEWVARQRIGYAEPNEIIFRFGEYDANLELYSYKKCQ